MLGFAASDYDDTPAGVDRDVAGLSTLAVTGATLGSHPGTVEVRPVSDGLVRAHLAGAEGLLVISNYDGKDWNGGRVRALLADKEARRRFVSAVSDAMARDPWDGVVLDFENLDGSVRDDFPTLVGHLAETGLCEICLRGLARRMAQRDVRDLVREDARELAFILHGREQAAVHVDVAAGQRERVDLRIGHREEFEVLLDVLRSRDDTMTELVQIIVDLGIVHVAAGGAELADHCFAELSLLRRRQVRLGGVAEIGQRLGRHGQRQGRHRCKRRADRAELRGRRLRSGHRLLRRCGRLRHRRRPGKRNGHDQGDGASTKIRGKVMSVQDRGGSSVHAADAKMRARR